MKFFRTFAVFLLTVASCGTGTNTEQKTSISGFQSAYYIHPTITTRLNENSNYDVISGNVTITHSTLGENSNVVDTRTQQVNPEKKKSIDNILSQMSIENYNDIYRWNGYSSNGGASQSDGDPLTFIFRTSLGEKTILIDTVDITILPAPLADLYNVAISLDFF